MNASVTAAPSRNAPCPCGSGEKYKRCCGAAGVPVAAPPPANPQALRKQFQHAVHMLRAGQADAAIPALLEIIDTDETHFDAHHALGAALLQAGRLPDAATILARAVALRPGSAPAHWDLGAAYDRQNLHAPAIEAYRIAVKLAPKLGEVQLRLGQLYALYDRREEASACFERAADASPNATMARLYRSDAQLLKGDTQAAEQWARRAVAQDPASSLAQGALAGLLYNQGQFEQAAAGFEAALKRDPANAKYWDGLAHCHKYGPADTAILDGMRAVLQRSDLPDAARLTLHFAMGKVADDCGDYARAMQHFEAGNRLRGRDLVFDRAALAAEVDANIRHFTLEFLARRAAAANPDETPLFIVGMLRSGTTLVEQIVSSHPDIAAGGELSLWAPGEIDIDPATGGFDAGRATAAMARYCANLRRIGGKAARVTDKLPTNFLRLGNIHALLPNARIIHCRRDPIDTCLSIYTTLFSSYVPFAARKADLVFCYRQYQRMMQHWRRVLPPGVLLEVDYERLVADRDAETRRLVAFTGLDWNEACLHPEQNDRAIGTSSAWQARQPVYSTSMQRWQRYEAWLEDLLELKDQQPNR
jgi:tetratricopeptide (TPR) repeat protein